jgi:hypothetical protein
MFVLCSVGSFYWQQSTKGILNIKNLETKGTCQECHTVDTLCCPHFNGNVKINAISISDEYIYYYFNHIDNPRNLLKIILDYRFKNIMMKEYENSNNLPIDLQLDICLILDRDYSVECLILKRIIAKENDLLPLCFINKLIDCALYFQDWNRYANILILLESYLHSLLFTGTNEKQIIQESFLDTMTKDQPFEFVFILLSLSQLLE